jgi:hypothetical protein
MDKFGFFRHFRWKFFTVSKFQKMEIFDDLKFSDYIPFQRLEILDICDVFSDFSDENFWFPIIFSFDLCTYQQVYLAM